MQLTSEQMAKLRAPFEESGALVGRSEDEIEKFLKSIAEIYITLANINLRIKEN